MAETDLPPCLQASQPERIGPPFEHADVVPMALAHRVAVLHRLHNARAMLDLMADTLRAAPDEDWFAEEAAGALMGELHRAGEALAMYRALRECRGQG